VVSNLSGSPHDVTCPWCGGSGKFAAGRDAQQSPAEQGAQQSGAERTSG
jgi:hypothetical protein